MKRQFDPTTVDLKTYIFTVVRVTNASEHSMTKSTIKSDRMQFKLCIFLVKVLHFLVVDKHLLYFLILSFKYFSIRYFRELGL